MKLLVRTTDYAETIKLAGNINIKVIKTGSQSSNKDDFKVIGSSDFLDKYRATKTIKTTNAKVDV